MIYMIIYAYTLYIQYLYRTRAHSCLSLVTGGSSVPCEKCEFKCFAGILAMEAERLTQKNTVQGWKQYFFTNGLAQNMD